MEKEDDAIRTDSYLRHLFHTTTVPRPKQIRFRAVVLLREYQAGSAGHSMLLG